MSEGDALLSRKMSDLPGRSMGLDEERARRYVIGVSLLFGVVTLWTVSNFITAGLETGDDSWNKPFLITYLNTSSFTLYLLPSLLRWYRARSSSDKPASEAQYEPISQSAHPLDSDPSGAPSKGEDTQHFSTRETAHIAVYWAAQWFVANWLLNVGLAWTSVASVTILSSTGTFFTLAIGWMFRVETISPAKILAVLFSFLGVILVTRSDSHLPLPPTSSPDSPSPVAEDTPSRPLLGDMAALVSAFGYAVYLIFMKVKVKDEDRVDMKLLLGFAGLFSTVALLPVIPLLHILGWETFVPPPTRAIWVSCGINMAITLSSDYMYMLAMLKTTPMLVTIGLSLTIPLALLISVFFPGVSTTGLTPMSLFGGAMVVLGFGMIGWEGWRDVEQGSAEGHAVAEAGVEA